MVKKLSSGDAGPFLETGVGKIAGKEDQKNGTAGDQTPVNAIRQETPAPAHSGRDNRIPDQVGNDMSGKEKSDAPKAESPGIEDVSETDRRPPDDPVRIGPLWLA